MFLRNAPDQLPWPHNNLDWYDLNNGLQSFSIGVIGFLVLAWIFNRYILKLRFFSGLILTPNTHEPEQNNENVLNKLNSLKIGDKGMVISTMRPAGKVRFAGLSVDCVAQAEYITESTQVVIAAIDGNRIVVKPAGP